MSRDTKRSAGQIALRILFLLYCTAMLWLRFGQRMDERVFQGDFSALPEVDDGQYWDLIKANCNFIPFHTVKQYLYILERSSNSALLRHAVINLVGNVVMFIPLGVFLPGVFRKKANFFKFLLSVVVTIVLVELLQLLTLLGSCDVDDLILNLTGAVIGYLIWKLFRKMNKSGKN